MNKTRVIVIGGVLIVLVAITVQLLSTKHAVAPQSATVESRGEVNGATTTAPKAKSTKTVSPSPIDSSLYSIAKGDSVAVWNFGGAYIGHPDLIAKADAEIKRFSDLIGTGKYTDTILYVSIANQYDLLGDGKQEYDYLVRAIKAGGSTTGLPWHNLGVLMARLGALETARGAYQKATLVQPELRQWHYAYIEFLTTRINGDSAEIERAFAAAFANVGQDTDILQLQSEWKKL
ncbi:MAG: hypothetical protein WCW36_01440 [Candidatus Paceibacterota bacterium]